MEYCIAFWHRGAFLIAVNLVVRSDSIEPSVAEAVLVDLVPDVLDNLAAV